METKTVYAYDADGKYVGEQTLDDTDQPKPEATPPEDTETTEEPTANVPETELAVMEGMVDMQSRIATLEAELAKLKGGK